MEAKLSTIDFRACEGSAAQGDWTGTKEISDAGIRTVSGDQKIANGWRLADYDALREQISADIDRLRSALVK